MARGFPPTGIVTAIAVRDTLARIRGKNGNFSTPKKEIDRTTAVLDFGSRTGVPRFGKNSPVYRVARQGWDIEDGRNL
jgi:hypothetical protein